MRSSIIVVSWNGEPVLADCLDRLTAQAGPDDEIIVVDNGSSDGSVSLVRRRYPQVRLIENGRNLGFAGGCNVGLRAAAGQALLLVNQDAVVRPGWLAAMLEALAPADVGIVGGKLLYPDGTIQHVGGILHAPQALPGHVGYHEADRGQWDAPRDVDYVTGAALGLKREVLERVGPFDEGFFPAFYEETDLCVRARAAGYRVVTAPAAVAVHRETTSVEREGVEYHRWMGRGRLRLVLKHQTPAQFHGDFVPAERRWLAAQSAPGLRQGLRAAYLDTLLALRDAPRGGVLADEGSEEAVAEALLALRSVLMDSVAAVDSLNGLPWAVEERPFVSKAPVMGPLITRLCALWDSVSARWPVHPLLELQNAINWRLALASAAAQETVVALDRGLADAHRRRAQARHGLRGVSGRDPVNLVHVGPLPPVRSGVADYSAALLPALRPHFRQIAAVVDGTPPQLPPGLVERVCDLSRGDRWPVGLPLYQMGNHFPYHRFVYRALQRRPGVVILHDGNLLPFVHKLTLEQGRPAAFVREAGFERGATGVTAAWTALHRGVPLSLDAHPMLARVARASLGVIVHSRCLRDRLLEVYPWARVAVIPHLDLLPPGLPAVSRTDLKRSLGLDPDGLLVAAFGFVAPGKRLEPALRAFARLREAFPRARFVCVGETMAGYDFAALLRELALDDVVQVTGYVPAETFLRTLRAADVGVNLRYPTWGESSGTLVRLMACGVPTLVTDAGAFAELPDGAVVKVPAGPDEEPALEAALRGLLGSDERRAAVGQAARQFVAAHCNPAGVAEQILAFLSEVLGY